MLRCIFPVADRWFMSVDCWRGQNLSRVPSRHGNVPRQRLFLHGRGRRSSTLMVVAFLGLVAVPGQSPTPAVAGEGDLYVTLMYKIEGTVRRCWNEGEFRRSVAQHVGYDPFRDSAAVQVSVRVGGSTRAVDGQVEWRNANGVGMGERRFVAKDGNCLRLLTEMSFATGLQIELLRPKASTGEGAPASASEGRVSAAGEAAAYAIGSASASTAGVGMVASGPAAALANGPSKTSSGPSLPSPPSALAAAESPPSTSVPGSDHPTSEKERRPTSEATLEAEPDTARASTRWPMWLGLGPALALGIAPSVTGSARLFFGVRRRDLSLELGAEGSYPSTERQWDGTGFHQSLVGASAAVCGHQHVLSACVLGKASQVRVSGFGVDSTRSPTGFVAQAGLRFAASWALGGAWSATAHLDALGLLTPYTVALNKVGVWDMPRLGALAGIDLSARFR